MNVFYLDPDPVISAQAQYDKHVVKMPLESAQMLCTAHRVLDGEHYIDASSGRRIQRWLHPDSELEEVLHKATHVNHPSNVWARETSGNYEWLYRHFVALCEEYTKRYGKVHKCERDLREILKNSPRNIDQGILQEVPQAMPDQYRTDDPVRAYRDYYLAEKITESTVYTSTKPPAWVKGLEEVIDEKSGKTKWKSI